MIRGREEWRKAAREGRLTLGSLPPEMRRIVVSRRLTTALASIQCLDANADDASRGNGVVVRNVFGTFEHVASRGHGAVRGERERETFVARRSLENLTHVSLTTPEQKRVTRVELFRDGTFSFHQDGLDRKGRRSVAHCSRERSIAWSIDSEDDFPQLCLEGEFRQEIDGECIGHKARQRRSYPWKAFRKSVVSPKIVERATKLSARAPPQTSDVDLTLRVVKNILSNNDSGNALSRMIRDGTNEALMGALGLPTKRKGTES